MSYIADDAMMGVTGPAGRSTAGAGLAEDFAMTIEIFYLTRHIQRWLDARVAHHLEAQAARLLR
jgi:hypothetical protein